MKKRDHETPDENALVGILHTLRLEVTHAAEGRGGAGEHHRKDRAFAPAPVGGLPFTNRPARAQLAVDRYSWKSIAIERMHATGQSRRANLAAQGSSPNPDPGSVQIHLRPRHRGSGTLLRGGRWSRHQQGVYAWNGTASLIADRRLPAVVSHANSTARRSD